MTLTDISPDPPRAVADLVGHGPQLAEVLGAVRGGRAPSAWIFTGPRGVGKETAAFALARRLLADGGASDTAVPASHPVFRQVAAAGHPDLLTIGRPPLKADQAAPPDQRRLAREIPVDDARRIAPFLRKTAGAGTWRCVIIDDADCLNRNAQNAVLKSLEEPPDNTAVFLVCHELGRLLPTLRSRSRVVRFAPLDDAVLRREVARRTALEGEALDLVCGLAQGSLGAALALAGQGAARVFEELSSLIGDWPALPARPVAALIDRISAPAQEADYRLVQRFLCDWLAAMARCRAGGTAPGPVPGGAPGAMAERAPLDRWLALWENTARLFEEADRASLDRRLTLVRVFAGLEAG